jgi:succinyl-diaminopimelate desuccinylase
VAGAALDPTGQLSSLVAALVDIPSESGAEKEIADAVETALRGADHLTVEREGDAVLARTSLDRDERVVIAGHLDTVPAAGNVPGRLEVNRVYGCGASDMKSGIAVMLRVALTLAAPARDYTLIFYDAEEIDYERNGLGRLARTHPAWLHGDLAVLMEPTSGFIEAGCQGTVRARVQLSGRRAHSARAWLGDNAIHRAAPVLARLADYSARDVDIDGCVYREGLSAVAIEGGVAGNVIPDACTVTVNFRFAPDRTLDQAAEHVREVFTGYDVEIVDGAPGALPGLSAPAGAAFIGAVGTAPTAKYGWTDVVRFAEIGVPALNYGPGDPNLAHTRDEWVEVAVVERCADVLTRYLEVGESQ